MSIEKPWLVDLSQIPEGWWLYGLFHNHTTIHYAGQEHVPFDKSGHGHPWTCKLQHVKGGKLTEGHGDNPDHAVRTAVQEIEIGKLTGRWHE